MANNNTDQIRRMTNQVVLAGPIAEIIDYKKDKTKDGIPYISFTATIRCGETPVYDTRFKIFSTAKKKDMATGEYVDRPNYTRLKDWCDKCVPMTTSTEDATWAEVGGYVGMNDYVNKEGKLVQAPAFNVNWVHTYEEYKAEINFEGMIQGMVAETRGEEEEETGRTRMRIVGTDIFGSAVDMKNIVADEEITELLNENGYESGALATYFISLLPTENQVAKPKAGGIGQQRTTTARNYLEYRIVGADPIIEEENEKLYIGPGTFKKLMAERTAHLKEIESGGYQGGKSSENNKSSSSKTGGIGKQNKSKPVMDDDDGNIPF